MPFVAPRSVFERRARRVNRAPVASVLPPAALDALEARCLMSATPGVPELWSSALGGNGNSYEIIIAGTGGISWEDAKLAAEARGGHLVTITSQAENDFVFSLINDPQYWQRLNTLGIQAHGPWIGAYRPPESGSLPVGEGWQWVTGEEFSFTAWATGEPNRTTERYAHFGARGVLTDDVWNNWVNQSATLPVISYIVEYEAPPVPVNEAPEFTSATPGEATEGQAFSWTITTSDPEGDALSLFASDLPDWLTLTDHGDGTATLTGVAGYDDLGGHVVTVAVSDGEHLVQQTFVLNVKSMGDITGSLFSDTNRNGVQDDGEAALAGWTVYLDANGNGRFDDGENHTTSGADGSYHLHSVAPGDHVVRVAAPIDLSLLDRLRIKHHHGRHRVSAELSDTSHFKQTWVDSRTLLLSFEAGDDAKFDEMTLEITFEESGKITLDVLDHDTRGVTFLIDEQSPFNSKLLTFGKHSLRGEMRLGKAWQHTTGEACALSTTVNELRSGVDFGLVQPVLQWHKRWCW